MTINSTATKGRTMNPITRAAIFLRVYFDGLVDDMKGRREQGDSLVTWVLVIIGVIVLAGIVYGIVSGWFEARLAEIVDPF
ncbi:hypothetical protein MOX01_37480 [Microbacterium oxydans]|nr:hypothetical protein MOX01_37480 [Microbacterium oxydans]